VIAECAADLVARIETVPSLANSTGISLGGRGADPGLVNIPLPACWVTFSHHQVDESPYGPGSSTMPTPSSRGSGGSVPQIENTLATFIAVLYVPYIDDNDLLTVEYPLLEAVIKAVKFNFGKAPNGDRWRFLGQILKVISPKRLVYEQHYTLRMMI
jgi:hypothetical protein